jgi:predicted ester cyclase
MGQKRSNLHILAEYSDRVQKGDTSAVYDYFAPGFHTHVAKRVAPGVLGSDVRAGEVMFWEQSAQAFPDRTFTVNKVCAIDEEDLIVTNWTMTGTHSGGSYFGVPPSGKKVEINGTAILRFEDGKIVEHWGGPHCMHGIGLLAEVESPTKLSAEEMNAKAAAETSSRSR